MAKNIIQTQLAKIRKEREMLDKKEKLLLSKANEKALEKIVQLARNAGLSGSAVAQAINAGKPIKVGQVKKTRRSGARSVLAGVKIPPKYRNPANPNEVWTGRGMAPRWVQNLKDSGRLESALIAPSANTASTPAPTPPAYSQ